MEKMSDGGDTDPRLITSTNETGTTLVCTRGIPGSILFRGLPLSVLQEFFHQVVEDCIRCLYFCGRSHQVVEWQAIF